MFPTKGRDANEIRAEQVAARHALEESEARLRRTQEIAHLGSWELDLAGNHLSWSDETFRIFGLSPQEFGATYEAFLEAVHPDDRAAVDAAYTSSLRDNRDTYEIEHRIVRRSTGEVRFVEERCEHVRDAAGKIVRSSGIVHDITARKDAEARLRESEARLNAVVENAVDGIATIDEAGIVQSLNGAAIAMFGYAPDQVIGRNVSMLMPEPDRSAHDVYLRNYLETGEAKIIGIGREVAGRRKDGSTFPLDLSISTISVGGQRLFVGLMRDITARKWAEDRLRESEERYRGIFEHAGTGIAITDREGRFQSCNPAYAAMLGYSEGELHDLVMAELMHPEDRDAKLAEIGRLVGAEIPSFEILNRYVRKDGAPIWVHNHVSVLRDDSGRPANLIALATDVTERKRHEEQVILLMREVNHRANNMLAVIQAIARQTAATRPDDFLERFDQRVHALAVSQDLLVKSEWRAVSLAELVRAQLRHFADLDDTCVSIAGPPLEITAAASQTLGMALHELATNAAKYGALSDTAGRVEICWDVHADLSGALRFTMSWTERGGPPVRKPSRRGFGSNVIEKMVKASLGCHLQLEYPATGLLWRIDCPADHVLVDAQRAFRGAEPVQRPASGRRRVLVVEDEPLIAMEFAEVLEDAGFEIVGPASSAGEALALLEQSGCDAAVLDVNLGGETSESVARALVETGASFVVVSGYVREQLPPVLRDAPLIGKPLRPEALVAEVTRCLRTA